MKKLLLLGGSAQQVVAIETAKRLGYYTVLCDFLPDNPGQHHADKFYLVSTTDKEAVLKVAMDEQIDGILAYASDPAAPTAAYVSEQLGLRTNPYASVDTLCNKDRFREFLAANGFHTPKAEGFSTVEDAKRSIQEFRFPIIVKPTDSSGSKGATVLRNTDHLEEALQFAFSFSRSHRIIVEEFIEKKHPYLIGGDIFVSDGKIILWGLLNCHRDNCVNPLVPIGKSFPLALEESAVQAVKEALQRMVDKLHIQFGAMNVELVVSQEGYVWPIDVGPRNGGNMIPDLLSLIFGVDVVEMTIKSVMEPDVLYKLCEGSGYYATHNLHSSKPGYFAGIAFSDDIKPYIIRKNIYKEKGDKVECFQNAAHALGIVFMKFDSQEIMDEILTNINDHIKVVLQ